MFTRSPIKTTAVCLGVLALVLLGGATGRVEAGEEMWNDIEGITGDDANRDAEAVRRSQSREDSKLNPVDENVGGQPEAPALMR